MFAAFSSSFITTPGMTRRIQFTLSLYGRMWIRWNSSRRCSPRIEAYRMFVSTPRMMSSYSARRRAIAVSPIGSTKPAQSRAEFSQARYCGESSRTFTRYDVGVPWISTSGYSSFEPPVPIDATVNRSIRPFIAPRASCNAGNSAIWPFSRSSRKLTSGLREQPVDHPLRLEAADVLVRLADVHEHDRLADRLRHRERRAAFRVRVDLREDDPIEADGIVELLRLLDRVVAREGVADVEDQVRLGDAFDLLHLVHQVLVRLHPACGIDQDDVPAARPRVLFSMRPKKSSGGTDNAFVIASRNAASTPCSRLTSREMRLPRRSSARRSTISFATGNATSDSRRAISRSYRISSSLSSSILRPESPIASVVTSASAFSFQPASRSRRDLNI